MQELEGLLEIEKSKEIKKIIAKITPDFIQFRKKMTFGKRDKTIIYLCAYILVKYKLFSYSELYEFFENINLKKFLEENKELKNYYNKNGDNERKYFTSLRKTALETIGSIIDNKKILINEDVKTILEHEADILKKRNA